MTRRGLVLIEGFDQYQVPELGAEHEPAEPGFLSGGREFDQLEQPRPQRDTVALEAGPEFQRGGRALRRRGPDRHLYVVDRYYDAGQLSGMIEMAPHPSRKPLSLLQPTSFDQTAHLLATFACEAGVSAGFPHVRLGEFERYVLFGCLDPV